MVVIPHLCCNLILQHKIWLKPSAEQQFVYGHHVMKSGLGRITENTSQYEGVVVYSMNDLPLVWMHILLKENLVFPKCLLFFIKKKFLVDHISELTIHACLQGFGVAAKSTQDCRHADPMTLVAFHQADIGEYIRNEEALL